MNINGHLIKDSEIVGIGPLMVQQSTDLTIETLYRARRYYFDLHLRAHSVRIETDFLYFDGITAEQLNQSEKKRKEFNESYHKSRDFIENHLICQIS